MPKLFSSLRECLGFSQIIKSAFSIISIDLLDISSKLPIGVATMYNPKSIFFICILIIFISSCSPQNSALKNDKKNQSDVLLNNKAYADYWKAGDYSKPSPPSELFVNSSKFRAEGITEIDWMSTMIHEIGHQVHFKGSGAAPLANKFKKMGGMNAVTGYSRKNPRELFAESFEQYVVNPEGLEKNAPRLYNWVEETLNNALTEL